MESIARREQIVRTAGAMFSRDGYHATTMRDIAHALDMQGGSLYAHIDSKEEVLWEIVQRAAQQFLAAVRPLVEQPCPARTRLRAMFRAHVGVVTRNLETATVFFHEWRFLGPARRARIAVLRDEYEALFRTVIQEGIAAGEFPGADPRLGTVLVLSAGNWLYQWFHPDGPLSADAVATQLADLLLAGLENVTPHQGGS